MKYEIRGETGLGYTVSGRWNHRDKKWLFNKDDDSHDGTGATFETLDEAKAELRYAQDPDVRNINIYPIIDRRQER